MEEAEHEGQERKSWAAWVGTRVCCRVDWEWMDPGPEGQAEKVLISLERAAS